MTAKPKTLFEWGLWFFGLYQEPIDHPFGERLRPGDTLEFDRQEEADDNDVDKFSWGKDTVTGYKTEKDDGGEWKIDNNGKAKPKLANVDFDEFDSQVCRENNRDPKKPTITPYELGKVKPYVLSGDYTNAEIAEALKVSLSWVQRRAPRAKDAERLRRAANPLPPKK